MAQTQLKAVREGKLLSVADPPVSDGGPAAAHRCWCRWPTAARSRPAACSTSAARISSAVPLAQLGQFSGHGAVLSARINGAEQATRRVAEKNPKDAETKQFVTAINDRLTDLSAAVVAAENTPRARPRAPRPSVISSTASTPMYWRASAWAER